jgi:putative ABC transport system permease protein
MWRDMRNAVRALGHAPSFTISAVLALALAVGANGAIFGLVDALWLRPPGIRDPATLVRVFATTSTDSEGAWSWREFEDIAAKVDAFEQVAVRGRRGAVLTADDGSHELLLVNVVSANFFEMAGIRPLLGRLYQPADASHAVGESGVVLGHGFWMSRFGGDPSIIGRRLTLGRRVGQSVPVLGVLPPDFRELDASADRDLWLSPQLWEQLSGGRSEFERRDSRWFDVFARRRAGVDVEQAQAQMAGLAAAFGREYPEAAAGRGARVVSDLDFRLERAGVAATAMLGLVLLVVLITCVNVANLLLARAAARAKELAVRVALGASRWRLVRQLTVESVVLGILGAFGGLIVASWFIRLLPALMTTPPGMRPFVVFQTDARVLVFTVSVTLVTTVLFGLAPALIAARADAITVIKASTGAARQRNVMRRALVGGQVAISLVMLCLAAALAQSYREVQRGDLGFARRPLLTLWATAEAGPVRSGEAVRQLGALPGVEGVAVALRAPLSLSGGGFARSVQIDGYAPPAGEAAARVKFNAVSANYFDVFGTRIVRGRAFSRDEEQRGEATVVVNEQFVREFLATRDPLGLVIRIDGEPHRILGVAQDGVVNAIGEDPQAYMYLPFARGGYAETTFVLATGGSDPALLATTARDVLRRIHTELEPRRIVTMTQYVEYASSLHRTTAALALMLGVTGLMLTTLGVYGVVAYRTSARMKELGIRMALGAMRGQVIRLVLRDGLTLAAAGVVAGAPLALMATRLTASMLVGITPWHPVALAAATAVLVLAVLGATLVPARRAMRVEPAAALRT